MRILVIVFKILLVCVCVHVFVSMHITGHWTLKIHGNIPQCCYELPTYPCLFTKYEPETDVSRQ